MYAIVTALREEVSRYLKRGDFRESALSNGVGVFESSSRPGVVVLEGGVGRENAEETTRYALEKFKPEFIISAGFAGAVTPGLEAGHLFLCNPLAAMDGSPATWNEARAEPFRSVDEDLAKDLTKRMREVGERFDSCGCMTVSTFISGSGLKSWIGRSFPVQLVDMESYWVCSVAMEHNVPSVVVRSVLDGSGQDLPYFVSCEARDSRRHRWTRALKHLSRRPLDGPGLLRLRSQSKLANESLSRFLEALHD